MADREKETARFKWVRSIGRAWILALDPIERISFLAAFALPLALHFLGFGDWVLGLGLSLLGLSFVLVFVGYWTFYRLIVCPHCGHNPTRYKNGRNLPRATARKKLAELEACPACTAQDLTSDAKRA
jgi:hypothetical protein